MQWLKTVGIAFIISVDSVIAGTFGLFHMPQSANSIPPSAFSAQQKASENTDNLCTAIKYQILRENAALTNEPAFAAGVDIYVSSNSRCFVFTRTIEVTALRKDYQIGSDPIAEEYYRLYQVAIANGAADQQPVELADCHVYQTPGETTPSHDTYCFMSATLLSNSATSSNTFLQAREDTGDISEADFNKLLQSTGFASLPGIQPN